MSEGKHRVCPVPLAGSLDNRIRKWLQNPREILGPYVKSGMTVLDFGCGPGFFTVELAELVGKSGKVIAVDLQEGMLRKLREKIKGTGLENRIRIQKCDPERIGVLEPVDAVVAFYVFHELPDRRATLIELKNLLKHKGILILAEPKYIHVSERDFQQTIRIAVECGFEKLAHLNIFMSRAAVLRNGYREMDDVKEAG